MMIKKSLQSLVPLQKNHFSRILNNSALQHSSKLTIATTTTNQQQFLFSSSTKDDVTSSHIIKDSHQQQKIEEIENPLRKLKSIAQRHDLCDKDGARKEDRHWTFALAISDSDGTSLEMKKAPILRTVHFQRISENGIDFIMKNRGYASNLLFAKDQHVSFLNTYGKYLPGEKIEQWRAQGLCHPIRLKEVIEHAPSFTIVEMVASVRAHKEGDAGADMDLSHFTDLVQQSRIDIEKGDVPMMELEEAVRGWRFVPYQVERMVGGPNQAMWDRMEWKLEDGDWVQPQRLMPF